jgi:radical SAM protein with 4Fe4S-binding SPASM domain
MTGRIDTETQEYRQEPPFALQVELTEGCSLRCSFCGVNGIRGKANDLKFMSVGMAGRIVYLLKHDGWLPRIEFAMHGEPSLSPNMAEILGIFRRRLPRRAHLMMISNGQGFVKDPTSSIDSALEYLNVLALDWYENVQTVPRILERYRGRHTPLYYPQNPDGNPHRRRKPGGHDLVVVQDIAVASKGTHATLNNHAGCGAPKNDSAAGKRCAKPFREMSIRWDGNVAICCNDWTGAYKCGNVLDSTLEEIWNGPALAAARKKLYRGQRTFGPCRGCDALSYRVGLLPDKKGRCVLPPATAEDEDVIGRACSGPPYTTPVLRPWHEGYQGVDGVDVGGRVRLPLIGG